MARPKLPSLSVTSASRVGLPRLSRISRAWTFAMVVMREGSGWEWDSGRFGRSHRRDPATGRAGRILVEEDVAGLVPGEAVQPRGGLRPHASDSRNPFF